MTETWSILVSIYTFCVDCLDITIVAQINKKINGIWRIMESIGIVSSYLGHASWVYVQSEVDFNPVILASNATALFTKLLSSDIY